MLVNSLKAWFEEGAKTLGVSIVFEPAITIASGVELNPLVWLPDFGECLGMVVFEGSLSNSELPQLACEAGYAASTMGPAIKAFEFNVSDFVDLLSDWGWSAPDKPEPLWLETTSESE